MKVGSAAMPAPFAFAVRERAALEEIGKVRLLKTMCANCAPLAQMGFACQRPTKGVNFSHGVPQMDVPTT